MTTIPDVPNANPTQAALLAHLRAIREMIPAFVDARPEVRRKMNFNAAVPDRFIQLVAVAMEASPDLARNLRFTAAALREVVAFTQTFLPVLDELNLLARSLSFTIADQRATAGKNALYAYVLSKTLNGSAEREILVPHIAAMKAALGPRGRRKATAAATDPPQDAATAKAK